MALCVGGAMRKYAIHPLIDTEQHLKAIPELILSDYRSGKKIGSLLPIQMRFTAERSSRVTIDEREAARILLMELVDRRGIEVVQKHLEEATRINT